MNFIVLAFLLVLTIQATSSKSNYSIDGSYNHPVHFDYGQFNSHQLRLVPPSYEDNISEPYGGIPSKLQGTRYISNLLFGREAAGCRNLNPKFTSNILTYWGQFIDHDLSWTPDSSGNCEEFKIPVPQGDPFYDPLGSGNKTMRFCRTVPVTGSGTNDTNIRQFPNLITSWLDASMIYGSTNQSASFLRTFEGGRMKTIEGPDGPQLPLNDDGTGKVLNSFMANDAKRVPSNQLFMCGDVRCNENPVLTSLTTLFVREHNRRADLLSSTMSDEQKYQEARRWVIAHIQAITFNEFLPTLTGSKPPAYKFDPSLNPQVSLFFSTVAFRYGHDQISGLIQRYDKNGLPIPEGHILLRDSYSFPFAVRSVGIGPYLRGASVTCQASPDAMLDEDLRTFLFDQSSALATDLAARNMQRARDHGIPSYNQCRKAFGLTPCETFACVNDDPSIISILDLAYGKDNVTYLDPFLGGLLEKKMPDSNLGQLFTTVIVEQLTRTRNADRYWFQNAGVFTKEELVEIETTKLSDVMRRNFETNSIPKDVFNMRDLSPYEALNHPKNNTRWIVPIIVLGSFAVFLIFVILFLLIFLLRKRRPANNDNEMK